MSVTFTYFQVISKPQTIGWGRARHIFAVQRTDIATLKYIY